MVLYNSVFPIATNSFSAYLNLVKENKWRLTNLEFENCLLLISEYSTRTIVGRRDRGSKNPHITDIVSAVSMSVSSFSRAILTDVECKAYADE